jgi:hypothetical protein
MRFDVSDIDVNAVYGVLFGLLAIPISIAIFASSRSTSMWGSAIWLGFLGLLAAGGGIGDFLFFASPQPPTTGSRALDMTLGVLGGSVLGVLFGSLLFSVASIFKRKAPARS